MTRRRELLVIVVIVLAVAFAVEGIPRLWGRAPDPPPSKSAHPSATPSGATSATGPPPVDVRRIDPVTGTPPSQGLPVVGTCLGWAADDVLLVGVEMANDNGTETVVRAVRPVEPLILLQFGRSTVGEPCVAGSARPAEGTRLPAASATWFTMSLAVDSPCVAGVTLDVEAEVTSAGDARRIVYDVFPHGLAGPAVDGRCRG